MRRRRDRRQRRLGAALLHADERLRVQLARRRLELADDVLTGLVGLLDLVQADQRRELGVVGDDADMCRVVTDYQGHIWVGLMK